MTPVTKQFSTELTLDPEAIRNVTSNRGIAVSILKAQITDALNDLREEMRAWGDVQLAEVYPDPYADAPADDGTMPSI